MLAERPPAAPEAQRQRALMAAFDAAGTVSGGPPLQLRETGARAARGLEAYRANAEALSDRALTAVFPTVRTMVGEADFQQLARGFWQAWPPQCGDLGEWGGEFPAWLGAHPAMAPWPYLADCARLDLALHRNERAADARFDAASLSLLESVEPERLCLQLLPGVQLLSSAWPIATIHHAHQVAADQSERAFEGVRAALAEGLGERVLVARQGWRAVVCRIDEAQAVWTRCVVDGANLDAALQRAGEGFDFAVWLGRALRESWLKGVVIVRD